MLTSDRNWLLLQWQQALLSGDVALLVIDEIQKVPIGQKPSKPCGVHDPVDLNCCGFTTVALPSYVMLLRMTYHAA